MKRGEKLMFAFAGIVVVLAFFRGYQFLTAEEPSVPKHFYEWDETGLQGQLLYREKGCNNCHRALGTGEIGYSPVLDGIGTRRSVNWLRQYLTDPGTLVNGTAHHGNLGPDFRLLTESERERLTAFLAGLHANPNSPNYPIRVIQDDDS